MELLINGKTINAKFNFGAYFKANAKFSSQDNNGNSLNDGATNLFLRVISEDLTVLGSLISLLSNQKLSDEKLGEAVDENTDNGNKIDELMAQFKEEMLESGFFNKAIQQQKKTYEEAIPKAKEMISSEKDKKKKESLEIGYKQMQEVLKLLNENS